MIHWVRDEPLLLYCSQTVAPLLGLRMPKALPVEGSFRGLQIRGSGVSRVTTLPVGGGSDPNLQSGGGEPIEGVSGPAWLSGNNSRDDFPVEE